MKSFFRILFVLLLFGLTIKTDAQNGVYFIPSEKQTDSMRAILYTTNNDTLKLCAYYYISSYYTELNKDSSLFYAKQQLQLANKIDQQLWAADACFQIAYLAYGLGNYPKALNSVTNGLAITDDEISEKNNWHISVFSSDGDAHRARLFIASSLHQVFAFLYDNVDDSQKAIDEYLKAIKIAESVDNKEELSLDYMSLSAEYMSPDKYDSALLLENKAWVYAFRSNYNIYLGTILETIGDIYFKKNNIDSAGKYYQQAIAASISQNNLKDEVNAFLAESRLKRTIHETDSSIYYARRALITSQLFGVPSGKQRAYNALYSSYKLIHKTDSAFAYLELAKSLGDSINGAERVKTNQYQSLNLNDQISSQEKEKEKIQSVNKTRTYFLLTGIFVLVLIAFLLFNNNRNRKKANELLTLQKKEIEQQKEKVENTLDELKSAQQQLIQSEKMASLGELTAGIAHEIQNPLNFVNNFSEVNKEMLEELKAERLKPNAERDDHMQDDLINDVIENSEKINHHGKRADAIVKGMLQHSRSSTGVKELTDINALADEYLRLSYHGLRSKDKSFNATMRTDLDESIGKINIVPQDIGRVLLNLYNNAFYAVAEKSKLPAKNLSGLENLTGLGNFVPTISISTKKSGNSVLITVGDNGNGIPQKVIDKIFQPFFTTKPTGQGTGLGLSLSYDIVKAHGGEIKVETKENEFTEFAIHLPVSS